MKKEKSPKITPAETNSVKQEQNPIPKKDEMQKTKVQAFDLFFVCKGFESYFMCPAEAE
ncbi:hypothetical protein GCM10007968_06110 [Sporolactobacillus putidus]|uniref:Uncharacterized protein n=1 Tax=Sporolactobacillus putidus TaxID=492735 RepID=A0A917RXP2_9BACL|nr:hypothetical protein GCM10007968_06110 [Sporolactobacillus putidus]